MNELINILQSGSDITYSREFVWHGEENSNVECIVLLIKDQHKNKAAETHVQVYKRTGLRLAAIESKIAAYSVMRSFPTNYSTTYAALMQLTSDSQTPKSKWAIWFFECSQWVYDSNDFDWRS